MNILCALNQGMVLKIFRIEHKTIFIMRRRHFTHHVIFSELFLSKSFYRTRQSIDFTAICIISEQSKCLWKKHFRSKLGKIIATFLRIFLLMHFFPSPLLSHLFILFYFVVLFPCDLKSTICHGRFVVYFCPDRITLLRMCWDAEERENNFALVCSFSSLNIM